MILQIPKCFYRVALKALIVDEQWRFLLAREDNNMRELPGGWMDFWEVPCDCLAREIQEELWLKVVSIDDQPSYFYPFLNTNRIHSNDDFYAVNVVYKVKVQDLKFTSSEECIEIKFFTAEEALAMDNIYTNVREFAKVYKNN